MLKETTISQTDIMPVGNVVSESAEILVTETANSEGWKKVLILFRGEPNFMI